MPIYVYLFLFILLSIITLVIYSFILRRNSISVELFVEALKNENEGYFEAAVISYEAALNQFKKTRFHNSFKDKIIQKLKLLHSLIAYQNNLRFIR